MQSIDLSPTGPAAFGVIAERFRRAGQPEKAVTLCREGLEKFPEHLSAQVTLGWSLLDMGKHQEAFDQLKSVLKRAPDNLAAIRGLAELHEQGIGLVFESFSESELEPEAEIDPALPVPMLAAAPDPEAIGDLDPIVEPARFEIEDVISAGETDSIFDLSVVLAPEPEPEPASAPAPISMFERAPLALRDDTDAGRVDELNDWLSRVRDLRSGSVSQSMAG